MLPTSSIWRIKGDAFGKMPNNNNTLTLLCQVHDFMEPWHFKEWVNFAVDFIMNQFPPTLVSFLPLFCFVVLPNDLVSSFRHLEFQPSFNPFSFSNLLSPIQSFFPSFLHSLLNFFPLLFLHWHFLLSFLLYFVSNNSIFFFPLLFILFIF